MYLTKNKIRLAGALLVATAICRTPAAAQTSSDVCKSVEIREAMQTIEDQYTKDPNGALLSALGSVLTGVKLDSTATVIDSKDGSDGGRYTSSDPGSFVCRGLFVRGNIKVQELQGADSTSDLTAAAIEVIAAMHPNFVEWFKVKPLGNGRFGLNLLPSSLALAREYSTQFAYPRNRASDQPGLRCTPDYPAVVSPLYETQFGKTDRYPAGSAAARAEQLLVAHDYSGSLMLYQQVANGGNAAAMRRLGAFFELGRAVTANAQQAMKWYRLAADAADTTAMVNIGRLYDRGNGVAKDFGNALVWYRKAADAGNSTGMLNTGLMYSSGAGVPRDYAEALRWFLKAADAGEPKAMNNVGAFYEKGTSVAADYSKAIDWYRKASELGLAQSMTNVGMFYESGLGIRRNFEQAACWYRKGVEGGDAWGMTYLGFLYNKGQGVPVDNEQAMKLYQRAAAQDNTAAMNNIGFAYENGWGVSKNLDAAIQWYRKAALAGDPTAAQNLSRLGIR